MISTTLHQNFRSFFLLMRLLNLPHANKKVKSRLRIWWTCSELCKVSDWLNTNEFITEYQKLQAMFYFAIPAWNRISSQYFNEIANMNLFMILKLNYREVKQAKWKNEFQIPSNFCERLVTHLEVSRFIHLIQIVVIYWRLTAWIINKFENCGHNFSLPTFSTYFVLFG